MSPLRAGGGGDVSRFVCGYMTCDPHLSRPILNGLPPVFKVNVRTDPSGHWLESSILHLVEESVSGRVGSEAMLAKLSEALFVDTLRRHVDSLPEQQKGWLAGARDPIVGRSLGLLHSRIAHPWTIADLADEVGISRSALVERFTRYLSEPPMTYLTRWRLQLAAQSLKKTSRSVAEIATDHRLRIRSRLQPSLQAGVWAASRPISQRSQRFARWHRYGPAHRYIVRRAAISSIPSHRFWIRRFSLKLCWLLS